MLGGKLAIVAHRRLEALPHLTGDVRLEANLFRPHRRGHVRMQSSVRIERGDVLVALPGQRANQIGQLNIDEVIGRLRRDQLRLGARTPAVGLRAKVGDLVDSFLRTKKRGKVGRQGFRGEAVDHRVALTAPAEGGGDGQQTEQRNEERAQGFHVGMSIKGSERRAKSERTASKKRARSD